MTDTATSTQGQSGGTRCDLSDPAFTSLMLVALDKGISIETYLEARSYGLAHDELVSIDPTVWDVEAWIRARLSGICGEDLREAKRAGITTRDYTLGRRLEVTHAEMIKAQRMWLGMTEYLESRRCGVSHGEAEDVVARYSKYVLLDYTRARLCGVSHDQATEVMAAKVYIFDYTTAMLDVGNHEQALAQAVDETRRRNGTSEHSPTATSSP